MKKSIILSVLGLTVAAVSSYGQGAIAFNTYNAANSVGILTTYGTGTGGQAGSGIDKTFTGQLLWSTVNLPDLATTGPVLAGTPITPGWNVGSTFTFATPGNIPAGYIINPSNLNIAGAVGQNLYFEVVAFTGDSYASSGYSGHSATFAATLATGTTLPDANQLNNLQAFSVYNVVSVPEPATLALAGLGGLASLVMLRRKKA
jgi:hypothetical protein